MVTIYDIAEKTGFSAPTISKALNSTGRLSRSTRDKILAVAREMGYETNMTAKALVTKKSFLIGVIFEDNKMFTGFEHPLFGGVLNRFRSQIEIAGYDLIFLSRKFDVSYLNHAKFRSVDGVVIINAHEDDVPLLSRLHREGMPCVSTNDYIPGVPTVLSDNEKDAYRGTEYLLEKGHRKIAFLGGPGSEYAAASTERFRGFRKCLEDKGIAFDENLYEECKFWDMNGGYDGFARLYARSQDFTALFCADDMLALGVVTYAEHYGIQIPGQISLLGYDDDRSAAFCRPGLTTFRQNKIQIADLAAEILMQHIAGIPCPETVRIPAEFIQRESVRDLTA